MAPESVAFGGKSQSGGTFGSPVRPPLPPGVRSQLGDVMSPGAASQGTNYSSDGFDSEEKGEEEEEGEEQQNKSRKPSMLSIRGSGLMGKGAADPSPGAGDGGYDTDTSADSLSGVASRIVFEDDSSAVEAPWIDKVSLSRHRPFPFLTAYVALSGVRIMCTLLSRVLCLHNSVEGEVHVPRW